MRLQTDKKNLILKKKYTLLRRINKDKYYLIMLILPVLYFLIFHLFPIFGNIIAFRKYIPGKSIFGEKWTGFYYFNLFINDPTFWRVFKNNIILSVISLIITFPIPVIFALLLNEITFMPFKRLTQTISYLPRFFSTVIVVGIIVDLLSPSTGAVNNLLKSLGFEPIFFMTEPEWFIPIYIASDIWQFTGWNSIIYLAAISGINPEMYDSASIDGANRFQQTTNITLPCIANTIIVLLVLSVGHILSVSFEKILLMQNPSIRSASEVLSTYVYRMGIENMNYSYSTAIGIFNTVISFTLLFTTNLLAKKYSETSLW